MPTAAPLLLYSTNTGLAFNIDERFYGGRHWVWCNPSFDAAAAVVAGHTAPPSSVPLAIYRAFTAAIAGGDHHSNDIGQNRAGLLRGIDAKLAAGDVDAPTAAVIRDIVRQAELVDFQPLVYVVPFARVRRMAVRVSPAAAAHPFSAEYQIVALRRSQFDIIRP